MLLYPPLFFAVASGLAGAVVLDRLRPLTSRAVPNWVAADVIGPLAAALLLAAVLRKRGRSQPTTAPLAESTGGKDWDGLREWFRSEEPTASDLFEHASISDRIFSALKTGVKGIALVGQTGSGKTSILLRLRGRIAEEAGPLNIVAQFSCWAMPTSGDAPRLALESIVAAVDRYVDTTAIRGLPRSYQRLVMSEPTGRLARLVGLDRPTDPVEDLGRLVPVLELIDARLVLIVEDAERSGDDIDPRPLERLLWTLRSLERVSFIISFAPNAGIDFHKLCEVVERVGQITASRVEEILAPAYAHWLEGDADLIDSRPGQRRDRLGLQNVTDTIARFARRTRGDSPADAITGLLDSPRKLKHFVRDVDRAWSSLRGEVDLDDLIVLTALRSSAPDAFDFLIANIEAARSRQGSDSHFTGEAVKTVSERWKTLRSQLARPKDVQTLVDVLGLPRLSEGHPNLNDAPQGIRHGEPVDYFGRILAGKLLSTDVPDQRVLRDLAAWSQRKTADMIEALVAAQEPDLAYADVWEHFAYLLTPEQIRVAADEVMVRLFERDGADASIHHAGMLATWRRGNRMLPRDSVTDWLVQRVTEFVSGSIGFATGISQYWCSTRHGVTSPTDREVVRLALVEKARETFTDSRTLLAALGSVEEFPITRLIFPPPTDEPADPVPMSSWRWFVGPLLDAARIDPERVLPDVAVLVGDSTGGFRDGTFERRYELKRDWVDEIFGDRRCDILAMLAAYTGTNDHALRAKVEAVRWIQE